MREVKGLFTLIPIWITFFGYSLLVATGNTFFFEQSSNMDLNIGNANSVEVPLNSFVVLRSLISFIIPFLFWSKKARQQSVTRIRIGVGMVCSILSCIAAWRVEVHRLNLIERTDPSNPNQNISMSVLWLVPQFSLLGLMEGLASSGLQEFFYNHVATSMRSYGPPFSNCVLGFGSFISTPLVLLFKSWFKDTINTSHLDRYYLALAILNFVFLCIYAYASSWYFNMESASKDMELEDIVLDGNDDITEFHPTGSLSSSGWRRKVAKVVTATRFYRRLTKMVLSQSPADIDSPEFVEGLPLIKEVLDDEPKHHED